MGPLRRDSRRRNSNDLLIHRRHPVHPAAGLEKKVSLRRRCSRRVFARLRRPRHFNTAPNVVDDAKEERWDAHRPHLGLPDVYRHGL